MVVIHDIVDGCLADNRLHFVSCFTIRSFVDIFPLSQTNFNENVDKTEDAGFSTFSLQGKSIGLPRSSRGFPIAP